ncbi:MAG: tetratricopeptide repeat protein, partial [Phycisphaerales bacterium]|nr:tetratricopeptide repeat protein [Phycisphaerales bacterium]
AASETIAAAMQVLAHTDAVMFDMRQNGGGFPHTVRFLCSYLFDEPTHLNSLYFRQGDRTEEFWTLDDLPGTRMPEVPVFVLTSAETFSGAEEFCYNLRTQERATLVGETTRGGANPGGLFDVNPQLEIFIPRGRAINPITGTNWEGTGVEPHIAVDAASALDKALECARPAAEVFRAARVARWDAFDAAHKEAIRLYDVGRIGDAAVAIAAGLRAAHAAHLMGEPDINMLGYDILQDGRTALAIAILTFNVETYPESSNAWDSLGEASMAGGQIDEAIAHYERSIELDPANENARTKLAELRAGQSMTP